MALEDLILGLLEGAAEFNYIMLFKVLFICLILVWAMVVVWAWKDSTSRSDSLLFSIFATLIVLTLNIFGLIIYLLIRPKELLDDQYWADLERRYLLYETDELRDCVECGYQLRPGFNLCPQCGTTVKLSCEGCQEMINKNWPYCPFCGTPNNSISVDEARPPVSINKNFVTKKDDFKENGSNVKELESNVVNENNDINGVVNNESDLNIEGKVSDQEFGIDTSNENSKTEEKASNIDMSQDVELSDTSEVSELDDRVEEQVYIEKSEKDKAQPVMNGVDTLGKKVMVSTVAFGGKVHKTLLKIVKPFTTPIGQTEKEEIIEDLNEEVVEDKVKEMDANSKSSRKDRRKAKKNKKRK